MPRRSKPYYDQTRDQWILRHQGKKHYLAYGRENIAHAYSVAGQIMGEPLVNDEPTTVTQACDAWLRENPGDWVDDILAPLGKWAKGTNLDAVRADYLSDYLKHLVRNGYAASTIRRQVRYARTVLKWAYARGYMTVPVPELPTLPKIPKRRRDIPLSTLEKIWKHLPKQALPILTWMRWTGARPSEACRLKHEEIGEQIAELERGKTWKRTGEPRDIVMSAKALEVYRAQPTKTGYVFLSRLGQPYTPAGLRSIIKRAALKAGYDLDGSYRLRHTFAQQLVDAGASIDDVGAALGHEPGSRQTQIYARVRQARVKRAIAILDGQGSGHPAAEPAPAGRIGRKPRAKRKAKKRKRASGRVA